MSGYNIKIRVFFQNICYSHRTRKIETLITSMKKDNHFFSGNNLVNVIHPRIVCRELLKIGMNLYSANSSTPYALNLRFKILESKLYCAKAHKLRMKSTLLQNVVVYRRNLVHFRSARMDDVFLDPDFTSDFYKIFRITTIRSLRVIKRFNRLRSLLRYLFGINMGMKIDYHKNLCESNKSIQKKVKTFN